MRHRLNTLLVREQNGPIERMVFSCLSNNKGTIIYSRLGLNGTHDIQFEMAADGTAKLYRSNGGTHLAIRYSKVFYGR